MSPISDADFHERQANERAYYRNQIESAKVKATREQTAEMRKLREAIEALMARLSVAEARPGDANTP